MKTTATSLEALMITLVLAPLLYMGIGWNRLPDTMAIQYDLQGNSTNWMPKELTALFIGAVSMLMYVLLRYLPRIDPTGSRQPDTYQRLRLVVSVMLASTLCWVIYVAVHSVGSHTPVDVLLVLISLLLAGTGNYLTTGPTTLWVFGRPGRCTAAPSGGRPTNWGGDCCLRVACWT